MRDERRKLGDILVSAGKINYLQLDDALEVQRKNKKRLGEVLIEQGVISESEIINTLSTQLSIKRVKLDDIYIDPEIARSIPKEVAKKYCLIPINIRDGMLVVAMSDPLNLSAIDDVRFITQKMVEPAISEKSAIEKAIEYYFSKQATDQAIEDLKKQYNITLDEKLDQAVLDDIQNAPAVRLTNSIINQAIATRASDIHIEPFESIVIVRYRVDGALSENAKIPSNLVVL